MEDLRSSVEQRFERSRAPSAATSTVHRIGLTHIVVHDRAPEASVPHSTSYVVSVLGRRRGRAPRPVPSSSGFSSPNRSWQHQWPGSGIVPTALAQPGTAESQPQLALFQLFFLLAPTRRGEHWHSIPVTDTFAVHLPTSLLPRTFFHPARRWRWWGADGRRRPLDVRKDKSFHLVPQEKIRET
jgi:hypothetical protein